jgi:hypothetical protein
MGHTGPRIVYNSRAESGRIKHRKAGMRAAGLTCWFKIYFSVCLREQGEATKKPSVCGWPGTGTTPRFSLHSSQWVERSGFVSTLLCVLDTVLLSARGSIVLRLLCNPFDLGKSIPRFTYAQSTDPLC